MNVLANLRRLIFGYIPDREPPRAPALLRRAAVVGLYAAWVLQALLDLVARGVLRIVLAVTEGLVNGIESVELAIRRRRAVR